jgi:hypothetical protein
MLSSLPDLQKERGFPHPSRKKKLLQLKRESTRSPYPNRNRHRGATRDWIPGMRTLALQPELKEVLAGVNHHNPGDTQRYAAGPQETLRHSSFGKKSTQTPLQ